MVDSIYFSLNSILLHIDLIAHKLLLLPPCVVNQTGNHTPARDPYNMVLSSFQNKPTIEDASQYIKYSAIKYEIVRLRSRTDSLMRFIARWK